MCHPGLDSVGNILGFASVLQNYCSKLKGVVVAVIILFCYKNWEKGSGIEGAT